MRVSDKVMYNTVTNNLQFSLEKILKLQENASSGKRINNPSDDPVGVMKVMDYNTAITRAKQYQRNINNGIDFLNATESSVSITHNLLVRAKEIAISGMNDTNSDENRDSMAEEVEQLYQETLQMANMQFNGRYLFGGYDTSTVPYSSDGSYNGTASPDGSIEIEIDRGSTIAINIPGYRAFGTATYGVDILGALDSLKTALENNDTQGIGSVMNDLDSGMNQLNNIRSEIGARINRLETTRDHLSKLELDLITNKSDIEDADITQVITELAIQQNVLDVSRATVSRVLQTTILDFLR